MPPPDRNEPRQVLKRKAGETIYGEGEPASALFVIEAGEIHLLRKSGELSQRFEKLGPGDIFGEQALLAGAKRGESAEAATDSTLIQMGPAGFDELVRRKPAIAARMLVNLSARKRTAQDQLAAAEASQTLPRDVSVSTTKGGRGKTGKHVSPPAAKPVRAKVVHTDSGTEFVLAADRELVVGRPDRASGTLPDVDLSTIDTERSLSRRHVKLYREREQWYLLEETATRNGTFVNGRRIKTGEAAKVKNGDRLRFGLLETTFHEGS